MIRWTFYFNEGNVTSTINTEEEDKRIAEMINEGGLLMLTGEPQIMINLVHVKAITRECFTKEQQEEAKLAALASLISQVPAVVDA